MNIAAMLGLSPVKPFATSKAVPLNCPDKTLIMGVELEIEGIKVEPTELYVPGIYGEADNSLRPTEHGVGWEYITKPATFSVLAHILSSFFGKAKLNQETNYSERCSVHVHANVQDLEPSQFKSLTLLYQVMERIFYGYAGNDRDLNIFCVPWSETTITHRLADQLLDNNIKHLRNWQKYTGLNLIPVTTQGTVEFRHLPGTCDLPRILGWLNLIGCLFRVAKDHPYDEIEKLLTGVNTSSEYRGLLKFVFGEWEHLINLPNIEELLEEGALNTKYLLLSGSNPVKNQKYAPAQNAQVVPAPEMWWGLPARVIDDLQQRPQAAAPHNPFMDMLIEQERAAQQREIQPREQLLRERDVRFQPRPIAPRPRQG